MMNAASSSAGCMSQEPPEGDRTAAVHKEISAMIDSQNAKQKRAEWRVSSCAKRVRGFGLGDESGRMREMKLRQCGEQDGEGKRLAGGRTLFLPCCEMTEWAAY